MTKADLWDMMSCCPGEIYQRSKEAAVSTRVAEKQHYQSTDQERRLGNLRKAIPGHETHF
jgi:hypothetical protein